jgi:hypothetical protein
MNTAGELQYAPDAFVGYNPIAAKKILSEGVVDGVARTTTATVTGWFASGKA